MQKKIRRRKRKSEPELEIVDLDKMTDSVNTEDAAGSADAKNADEEKADQPGGSVPDRKDVQLDAALGRAGLAVHMGDADVPALRKTAYELPEKRRKRIAPPARAVLPEGCGRPPLSGLRVHLVDRGLKALPQGGV